jgi:hypothetical protein
MKRENNFVIGWFIIWHLGGSIVFHLAGPIAVVCKCHADAISKMSNECI